MYSRINEDHVVKVADFGLSRDLYEKDYYRPKDRNQKMPIKWMALESLEEYIFNTKTDVVRRTFLASIHFHMSYQNEYILLC